ncbi:hypothetical protein P167DRAFT_9957 [Morchella conica CCBAS932]|uniref:Uncharacterized protein n=1 Tax=Morchella conica CCBAS932 TaxID=1392247 RepID=A0A3N4L4C8_9PEZI|nr:hypothetical protein P167DRAFT_9957 [Morchella conica CCBAS932]
MTFNEFTYHGNLFMRPTMSRPMWLCFHSRALYASVLSQLSLPQPLRWSDIPFTISTMPQKEPKNQSNKNKKQKQKQKLERNNKNQETLTLPV